MNTRARALPPQVHEALSRAIPRTPKSISPARKRAALAVAALSDLGQWFFFPVMSEGVLSPFEIALDAFTALVILLIVGFQWRLAIALVAELVPGLDMFPTWMAVVLSLPTDSPPPKLPASTSSGAPELPPGR